MNRNFITVLLCITVLLNWINPCISKSLNDTKRAKAYSDIIDGVISRCQAKSALINSGSYHIRTIAVRSTLKSAYLQSHNDDLISYLMTNKISLNKDQVMYHLNHKFFDAVRHNEIYSLVTVDRSRID